jgi:hypothetical protein
MTVEAYLRSLVTGLEINKDVLTRAAYSPIEVGLEPFNLEDPAYPKGGITEEFQIRLDYAASTVYYSVLSVFAGGGYSEQVGNVRVSRGGYTITMADRARFQALADNLRLKHGFDIEGASEVCEVFDAGIYRGAYQISNSNTVEVPEGYEALFVKK